MGQKITPKKVVALSLLLLGVLVMGVLYVLGGRTTGKVPNARPKDTAPVSTTPRQATSPSDTPLIATAKTPAKDQAPTSSQTQTAATPQSFQAPAPVDVSADTLSKDAGTKSTPSQPPAGSSSNSPVSNLTQKVKNLLGGLL
ncbi:MAG: hypothetical protein JWS12_302 [Candidatus Saccharibacteria bacterium]|nr:hypothetical protein [Candidatus Saccharibacteria bacterium]